MQRSNMMQDQCLQRSAVQACTAGLRIGPAARRTLTRNTAGPSRRPPPLPACFAEPLAEAPAAVPVAPVPQRLQLPVQNGSYCPSYEDEPSQDAFAAEALPLEQEAARLSALLERMRSCATLADKIAVLDAHASLNDLRRSTRPSPMWSALEQLAPQEQYVIKCLPLIGQPHVLALEPKDGNWQGALRSLAASLLRVESFYDSMGGLIGYQLKSLELILGKPSTSSSSDSLTSTPTASSGASSSRGGTAQPAGGEEERVTYHVPPGLDLAGEAGRQLGVRAAAQGLMALPYMAEIYPVGGAGDRLGLQCEVTGQSLPAAMLPYCGRSMIEGLIRDLQAREYLHWHLTGRQVTTPAAIMTSDAKGNHARISALMEHLDWFGRGKDAFRLFRQPLVPIMDVETGCWLLSGPLKPMMKPGGHGAIWKLMHDEGVFTWLEGQRRASAIVRQISNPMAGVDTTLLALAGTGFSQRRAFGFMSCERVVGAAEGMNVLQERKRWMPDPSHPSGGTWEYEYAITNVEYTEFERLGISDMAQEGSNHSVFPANTNILYVGLQAAKDAVQRAIASGGGDVLPGLIFNRKKRVVYKDPTSKVEAEVKAGRMECTMQNLADALASKSPFSMLKSAAGSASSGAAGSGSKAGANGNGMGSGLGSIGSSSSSGTRSTGAARESDDAGASLAVVDRQLAQQLSTFMVYNLRRKVTSSAKKRRAPSSKHIHQTPDGSFYDLMRNGWQVLQRCGMRYVPEIGDVQSYLENGPGFIFLFHPALGPLWDVIAQKLRGGALLDGSELVLEVAEARLLDVTIDGSLLVRADCVMGHMEEAAVPGGAHKAAAGGSGIETGSNGAKSGSNGSSGRGGERRLHYSSRCGRVHMMNVTVQNVGVDWHHPGNVYWRHQVQRHEACRIVLHGTSEFEAYDCKILGDQLFEVPDGYRMVVTASPRGSALQMQLLPLRGDVPTWEWRYSMDGHGAVRLEFERNSALVAWGRGAAAPAVVDDHVLDFVI